MMTGRCAPASSAAALRHLVRVGLDDRRRRWRPARVAVAEAEDHVERQVEEDRAAVRRERGDGRVVQGRGDVVGGGHGGRVLGDRRDQRHVVDLLQAAGAPAELRRPAAEHDAPARR